MKQILILLTIGVGLFSCTDPNKTESFQPVDWDSKVVKVNENNLEAGVSYLSVYSQIYSLTEHRTHDLTVTVSIRNTHPHENIYVKKVQYFNTKGELIRNYFDKTILVKPMETLEIVIDQTDREGGSGANFLFEWLKENNSVDPLFEAIMISTSGQQGLSFSTQSRRVR